MEHLIPPEWFVGLAWWWLLLITAVSLAVLGKGADLLVEGASGLAYRLGMPKVIVGATIVSLGTTSPEAAVSVMAAWSGNAGLALGNAVGSIIADTALIFGLGCVIAVLPADKFVLKRQGWVQFGSAALLAALCYGAWLMSGPDAALGRWVGVLLLALLVGYMAISVRWSRQHAVGEPFQTPEDVEGQIPVTGESMDVAAHSSVFRLLALVVIGLALVIFSSHVLILAVSELAVQWGVSQQVIAATLVAFGTSLPELVVGMTAIYKGHKEILVGNVIGADILNVLFVIGASAVAKPLPILDPTGDIPAIMLYLHIPVMLLTLVLFRVYIAAAIKHGSFKRWFGYPLLAIYVGYIVAQYAVSVGNGEPMMIH